MPTFSLGKVPDARQKPARIDRCTGYPADAGA